MRPRVTLLLAGLTAGLFVLPRTAAAQDRVACVGDSITHGVGASSATTAYPAVLQRLLGDDHAVTNAGKSGATLMKSGDSPYWGTPEQTASTAWVADGGDVVIQLGTNDTKPSNWWNATTFAADCTALVEHYRASDRTRVWLALPPPATSAACCSIDGQRLASEVLPLLRSCAAATGASTIDVHAALLPFPEYFPDGVHPDDRGAALLAETVRAALAAKPAVELRVSPAAAAPAAEVTLEASATAAYGRIERIEFFDGEAALGTASAEPWQLRVVDVPGGAHAYSARAVETAGREARSAPVAVVVDPATGSVSVTPAAPEASAATTAPPETQATIGDGARSGCALHRARPPARASGAALLSVAGLAALARRAARRRALRGREGADAERL